MHAENESCEKTDDTCLRTCQKRVGGVDRVTLRKKHAQWHVALVAMTLCDLFWDLVAKSMTVTQNERYQGWYHLRCLLPSGDQ